MNLSKQAIGWLQGFLAVFVFLGLNHIICRYSFTKLDINPVIFSCCAFSSCALVLIAMGGHGPLVKETIRSIDTWLYGIVLMLSYILGISLYGYITSTELTIIQKVSVGLTMFFSWLFLARKPDIYQLIGTLIVTVGVVLVAYDLDSSSKSIVLLISFMYGALQAARVFLAELHRPHSKAAEMRNDPKGKERVIGFIMLIVSIIFLTGSILVAILQHFDENIMIKGLPKLHDFQHTPTIITGLLFGIVIMAPLRVLEFASSQTIKAENFMVILTFTTIATLTWEWSTQGITGMDIKTISGLDLIAVIFITAGGLVISLTRKIKKKDKIENYLQYSAQNIQAVEDSREIIAHTLEHFKSNVKKSAHALKVPQYTIKAILEDKEKVLAFKDSLLKDIARSYRRNVAGADALTGLLNRTGFMTALKTATVESDNLSLFFIDLNKFKPVNDTYGHDAGDYVLQVIADRFKKLFPKKSLITRLGGDEYCILLLDIEKHQAENKIKLISKELEKDINYKNSQINVKGSIGLANYPTDTKNAVELINLADKQMYVDKEER